ncbi:MAG: PP2C family protein-serine/threonine phosphatase [Alphaproteobacteria bacterium]|nr:PP2C family protein-serine/threonine phosphatase [Alphaproteobacteria bacterium]
MKRVFLILGILVILGIGLGPWAYRTFFMPGVPIALPTFDYRTTDSWAALPAESPAPVWKDGWAVDVILVGPGTGLDPRSEADLLAQTNRAKEQSGRLAETLSLIGPVYAPLYRSGDEATDLAAAFRAYVGTNNRGRAFVIATDHALPSEMLSSLTSDEALRARFGGFLRLTRAKGATAPFPAVALVPSAPDTLMAYCPDQYDTADTCQPIVRIGRQDGMMIVAQDTPIGGENLAGLTAWLEANVAKTAEPLGSLEEVEIIDIRRPGDTDAKRAEDEN